MGASVVIKLVLLIVNMSLIGTILYQGRIAERLMTVNIKLLSQNEQLLHSCTTPAGYKRPGL